MTTVNQVDALLTLLCTPPPDSDDEALEQAAIALGQLGSGAQSAIQVLRTATDPDQRFWGVRALWANGDEDAQQALIQCLEDADSLVRAGAALALGELHAARAVDDLARLMTLDPSEPGNHAADALAKIGAPAQDVLIVALKHPDNRVRIRAAKALIPVESHAAIRPLIDALDNDPSYLVRYHADVALRRMGVGEMIYFTPE